MPKRQKITPKQYVSKRLLSKRQQQKRRQRIILLLGALVIIAVGSIIGYGYYDREVRPYHRAAIRVNDTVFDMGYYIKMLRIENRLSANGQDPYQLADNVAQQIQDRELLRQEAAEFDISVTREEIDQEMEEYQDLDSDLRKRIRIDMEQFLLVDKLREHFAAQMPTVAEQVHLEGILAETKDGAEGIASRLNGGEDFASLAQELSQDNKSKEQGGDLGWLPRGVMGPEFDEVAFSLEPGALSQPIPDEGGQTEEGHWVIRVLEKDEARPIDEDAQTIIASNRLNQWFEDVKQDSRVENYLDEDEDKKWWAIEEALGL